MNLGGPDLIVILLIVLVLFGSKKLPDLAKGMGQAMKEFQKAKDDFSHELSSAGKSATTPASPKRDFPGLASGPTQVPVEPNGPTS